VRCELTITSRTLDGNSASADLHITTLEDEPVADLYGFHVRKLERSAPNKLLHAVTWVEAKISASNPGEPLTGEWLIIGSDTTAASRLNERLHSLGIRSTVQRSARDVGIRAHSRIVYACADEPALRQRLDALLR
jgi:hypothetical protein